MIVECDTVLACQSQLVATVESLLEEERRFAESRAVLNAPNSPDRSLARLSAFTIGSYIAPTR